MLLYKDFHKVHYEAVQMEKVLGSNAPSMGKGATQKVYVYPNGYGASVVNGFMTGGLDELAVIWWYSVPKLYRSKTKRLKKKLIKQLLIHNMAYNTPITNDVKRYTDKNELNRDIQLIGKLNKNGQF